MQYVSVCLRRDMLDLSMLFPSLPHASAPKARHNMVRFAKSLTAMLAISLSAITVNGEHNTCMWLSFVHNTCYRFVRFTRRLVLPPHRARRLLGRQLQQTSASINRKSVRRRSVSFWDVNHNIEAALFKETVRHAI